MVLEISTASFFLPSGLFCISSLSVAWVYSVFVGLIAFSSTSFTSNSFQRFACFCLQSLFDFPPSPESSRGWREFPASKWDQVHFAPFQNSILGLSSHVSNYLQVVSLGNFVRKEEGLVCIPTSHHLYSGTLSW